MVGCRKSIEMRMEVLKLKDSGHSSKKIAKVLKISKNTVRGFLKNRDAVPTNREPLSEARSWSETVPWDQVRQELTKRYVTVKQLFKEYAPKGIDYLRFWREMNRRLPPDLAKQVRIRMRYCAVAGVSEKRREFMLGSPCLMMLKMESLLTLEMLY